MKKKLAATLSVVLILGLAVLGILAYLTSEDSDVNVMTLGEVDIEQTEVFEQGDDLYPNTTVKKEVTVTNTGKSEAFVRTWFAFENPVEKITANWKDGMAATYVGTDVIDGTEYSIYVLSYGKMAKDATVDSLQSVYMSELATNEDMVKYGDTYEVLVFSQAVQTAGFDTEEDAWEETFGASDDINSQPWGDAVEIPTAVATADDLAAAIADGKDVYLTEDVDMGATQVTIPAGEDVTLNLNGNDITGTYADADHYAMFTIPNGATLTVEGNGEVKANTQATENNRSLAIFQNDGDLTINGGTYNVNDSSEGKTWIIATIVDNRTKGAASKATLTVNGGDFSVSGKAVNLFRNYPQQGGTATIIVNGGTFNDKEGTSAYIWNQEAGSYLGELYFNGGTYDAGVVYEDYNGQSDIHIADGVKINAYSGNN